MDIKELCKKYGIGLTGGVGCGKSTVARILKDRGYTVIDADMLARRVLSINAAGLARAVEVFGGSILREDGQLDRAALAEIVFRDESARKQLEEITHPLIETELAKELEQCGLLEHPRFWFYEATLLYERGRDQDFRQVWCVSCSPSEQMQRLISRSSQTKEFWEKVIDAQMNVELKVGRADVTIDSSGPVDSLPARVDEALLKLPGRSGIMKIQAKSFKKN